MSVQPASDSRKIDLLRGGERPPLEFPGYWLYAGETPCVHVADRRSYLVHAAWLGLSVPHEPPGTGGASYAGTGNYYLVFETREGQAIARYRLQVNRTQWFRFTEGSRVRITLNNNDR